MEIEEIIMDEEDLITRHRQEKKDLQAKVQSMKKSIPKGDKKKKKEITEEITKLEIELEQRHKEELIQLKSDCVNEQDDINESKDSENVGNASEIGGDSFEICNIDNTEDEHQTNSRVSRAQKRRNKKESEAREREKRIAEQAEKNKEGPRAKELSTIKQVLKSMNLRLHNIPADGNCLYLAVNHQLQVSGRPTQSVNELRKITADFMRKNKDDFLPFMCNELDESEVVSEEQFESYCKDVATTKLWGGQLELRALSNIFNSPIKVIQAAGPPTLQGESFKGPELILTYHRHLYRLGEHYNSTVPVAGDEDV